MTNELVPFELNSKVLSTRALSSGGTSFRLLTGKEYKEAHGLKGQEGKRAYFEYVRQHGLNANMRFSARLASGEIVITGGQNNKSKDGGTIKWKRASKFEDKESAFSQVVKMRNKVKELEAQLAAALEQC